MSLFTESSLCLVPSGVKEDKVYSIKPTDGSGDLTFSRGSDIEATRVASNGYIEKAKVNLVLQSNTFSTSWVNSNSTETSGQSGYDGSSDAWQLTASTTGAAYLQQTNTNSGVQTFSVYAKAGTADHLQVYITGTDSSHYFDLTNGTASTATGTGAVDSSIQDIGSGWYRCSCVCNGTNATLRLYIRQGIGVDPSAGEYIYIQDAQLNYGLVAQDYVETTTTSVVSGITNDLPRLDYSGGASCPSLLLEPSRTNLITQSEYFGAWTLAGDGAGQSITTNYATSPEGVANATRIQLDKTGGTYSRISISASGTSGGVSCVFSVYLKANSGSPFVYIQAGPNIGTALELTSEWQRFTVIGNASGGTTSCIIAVADSVSGTTETADILAYGAQLESSASYPSSIIPTYGTSATRTAESCSKTGISSLIGQTAGSFYAEIEALADDASNRVLSLSDGTSSNRVLLLYQADSNKMRAQFSVSGQSSITIDSVQDTTQKRKLACAWDSTSFVFYIDGVKIGETSTGYTFSDTLSALRFDNVSGGFFYGEMSGLLLFTSKLSNSDLAALTA